MTQQKQQTGISVFYSYASADRKWRDQLAVHLTLLKRDELIEEWSDQQIPAGDDRALAIDQALHSANIILLLISADFLASDACYDQEMQQALERHRRGEARVVPIIVRPCDWQHSPFAHLQYLPRNTKPISNWDNQDEAFVTIAQELRRVIALQQFPPAPLSNIQRQNRTRLLKRVRTTWIEGLLNQSLHRAAWIDLHLQKQPDALENPWRLQVQELDQAPHALPLGTSIVEVYDEADGELLLLGEPGSGKTTLLLQLARTFLDRALADDRFPMPVVFNLSSWAQKKESLATWLVDELKTKYQVPRQVAQYWIDTDQVLPLLDGLDEVANHTRNACVQQINNYYQSRREQRGSSPIVVCSRGEEYAALSTRILLLHAVSILPLTDEQINAYFEQAGEQVKGLKQALNEDTKLYSLARQPLILNIFTLAYQGAMPAEVPVRKTREEMQRIIFARYVERMLKRRSISKHFSREKTMRWLTFLAKQMMQHNQIEFYIERLQPDWLSPQSWSYQMYRIFVRLVAGLLVGIAVGSLVGLFYGPFIGAIAGLISWLLGGLVGWFFSLFVYQSGGEIKLVERVIWSGISLRGGLLGSSSMRLIGGVFSGVIGLLVGGLFIGLIGGLLAGLIGGLGVGVFSVLLSWLCMSLLDGLSSKMLREQERIVPNEGIHRSALNSVVIGLCFGFISGLAIGLGIGFISILLTGHPAHLGLELSFGLCAGIIVGIGTAMPRGGLASIQHVVLRLLLWHSGVAPLNYVQFLEDATKRLLLHKVSGSYIFVHRLLLEYFATLDETAFSESISSEDKL